MDPASRGPVAVAHAGSPTILTVTILAVDVGTSSVRVAAVDGESNVVLEHAQQLLPSTPSPGFVELDGQAIAAAVLEMALEVIRNVGSVDAVGIANQRGSTLVWDRSTGELVGPGLGWQDLRTLGKCLQLQEEGLWLYPNQSATKLAHLLDLHDPGRERDLCFGTVESWITWFLSDGSSHVCDLSNAGLTGLVLPDGSGWDPSVLELLHVPEGVLPAIVDSSAEVASASKLPGSPPVAGLLGDQQASLLGQGCVAPGQVKATFGTGAMLDVVVGPERPGFESRGPAGTIPIVAWRFAGGITWGVEAVMLSAGANIEWLRDDLGLLEEASDSHRVAGLCDDTGGVVYVPALFGLGTPSWDYGARGALLGVTRGSGRSEIVRAVLEGVAHRGADLVEAAETDAGVVDATLRVDGGMSRNPTFAQALADASGRVVEVSPVVEATTVGAAFAAGLAIGVWSGVDDVARTWEPAVTYEPGTPLDRERWRDAVARAGTWYPELSALNF